MKSTVLGKDIALLFSWGADDDDDDKKVPRISENPPKPGGQKKKRRDVVLDDDDDDDEDDDPPRNEADRRRRRLSRENSRRRIENKNLQADLEDANETIASLQGELKKAVKVQTAYDNLKQTHESQQETVRNMAIRNAIASNDKLKWYDVNMVVRELDQSAISVDLSDFKVGGLEDQLKSIAKDKPFLVKAGEESSQQQQSGNNEYRRTPSGQAPQSSASGTRAQEASANESQMLQDFPALQKVI